MSTLYPTSTDTFTVKANGQIIDASHIDNLQDSTVALQNYVGIVGSTSATSVTYKLTSVNSTSPGHVHNATDLVGTVSVANGGTAANTAAGARNNLLPTQSGNAGYFLQTDGTNVSWQTSGARTWIGSSFESTSRFLITASGSGTASVTFGNTGASVNINGTLNTAYFTMPYTAGQLFNEFNNNPVATFVVTPGSATTGGQSAIIWAIIGGITVNNTNNNNKHIGFKIIYTGTSGILYATQGSGTGETSSVLLTGITNNFTNTLNLVAVVGATSVTYSATNIGIGSASLSLSANMPTGNDGNNGILAMGAWPAQNTAVTAVFSGISYQR